MNNLQKTPEKIVDLNQRMYSDTTMHYFGYDVPVDMIDLTAHNTIYLFIKNVITKNTQYEVKNGLPREAYTAKSFLDIMINNPGITNNSIQTVKSSLKRLVDEGLLISYKYVTSIYYEASDSLWYPFMDYKRMNKQPFKDVIVSMLDPKSPKLMASDLTDRIFKVDRVSGRGLVSVMEDDSPMTTDEMDGTWTLLGYCDLKRVSGGWRDDRCVKVILEDGMTTEMDILSLSIDQL